MCSKRRRRCDGSLPCLLCSENNRECTYDKQPVKRGPRRRPSAAIADQSSTAVSVYPGCDEEVSGYEDGYADPPGHGYGAFYSTSVNNVNAAVDPGGTVPYIDPSVFASLEQGGAFASLSAAGIDPASLSQEDLIAYLNLAAGTNGSGLGALPSEMNSRQFVARPAGTLPPRPAASNSPSRQLAPQSDSTIGSSTQLGVLVSKEPPLKESVPPIPTTAQLSFLIAPNSLQSSKTGDSTVARARVFPATAASVVHAQLGLIDMNSLSSNPSSAVSKRQRGEEDEYIRYEYALPQTFAELEALFGSSPMLPTSSSGSSNRDLALVKEPGFFDDLPPLPDQKILTELVSRFFEDVFVASPVLHKPSFLSTLHLRPPYLIYAMGAITAPYCSHIPNRLSLSLNLLERCRRLILPAGSGNGPKSCDLVIALFYGSLAASRSWKKGYAKMTATFNDMAVSIARELGLNLEPGAAVPQSGGQPARGKRTAKGAPIIAPDTNTQSSYGLPKWIADEERRRIWWQLYILDRLSMAVSDRPAQINESECRARVPCSNYVWLREADASRGFVDPGNERLGIDARSVLAGEGSTVWSEVGAWVIIFRGIGEVFGQFHQFCKLRKIDPYVDPAELRRPADSSAPMRLNQRQEEVLRRFDSARDLLDATYERLPPHFHEIDADPIKHAIDNWDNLRRFRNDQHRPVEPYGEDQSRSSGPPPDRHNVLEALYLLLILHNAYAMLHAPKNPHPALDSTKYWLQHQAVLGVATPATRPIMRMAGGANGVTEILRWFPFSGMASGPFPMSLSDGSQLHDFGGLENWPPSPAAICHFHCCKVTELQRAIMMLDEQLVSIPAFCLWSSAQAVIYRLLLHTFSIVKETNEAVLQGKTITLGDAVGKMMADINLHTTLMEKLSKRWPAAMAAFILTKHIISRALEGNMQDDADGVFTTVGVISDPGKERVDNLIGHMEELELGHQVQLDQPPAPKKTPSIASPLSALIRRGSTSDSSTSSPALSAFGGDPQRSGTSAQGLRPQVTGRSAPMVPMASVPQLTAASGGVSNSRTVLPSGTQAVEMQNQLQSLVDARMFIQAAGSSANAQRQQAQYASAPEAAAAYEQQMASVAQMAGYPQQQQRPQAETELDRLMREILASGAEAPATSASASFSTPGAPSTVLLDSALPEQLDHFEPETSEATAAYKAAMFRNQKEQLLKIMAKSSIGQGPSR